VTGVDAVLRRRKKIRNKWLLTTGVVLAFGVGAVLLVASPSEPTGPREAVQQYEDARAAGDWSRAWDLLCESEQKAGGPEQQYLAANEDRVMLREESWLAEDSVRLSLPIEAWRVAVKVPESNDRLHELVIRENGNLRVCGDPHGLFTGGSRLVP
jgi:hypothetical protein